MALCPGTRLGPYEVICILGSGGMAEVYRARDVRLGREVAIKILPEVLSADREALARFDHEARSASALNHPHLVTIHDIGEAEINGRQVHYIAMELIRGATLRLHMHTDDPVVSLRHLANVADGLACAHDHGIIHRDLKPENVMISDDGLAKVVDFGLSKQLPLDDATLRFEAGAHVTSEGTIVGTIGYAAPEQLSGKRDLDHRVDIFSFGCILYEVVARRPAFDGETAVDVMHNILHGEPPPLASPPLDFITRKCLAKHPARRYASMHEVAADIRDAMQPTAVHRLEGTRPRRAKRWIAALIVAMALVAALALVRARSPVMESIAVLPFVSATDAEFLGDGMTEELVRDLSRVPGLRVIANSSTLRYRRVSDLRAAARELNVDAVLVGTMSTDSGALGLETRLVRASDGALIWRGNYRRMSSEVAALERDVLRDLCEHARLKPAPPRALVRSPEAYTALQRGRRAMRQQTAPSLKAAIEEFHKAIELEPDYAEAWVALGYAHGRQAVIGVVPTRDGVQQEKVETQKALMLDGTLAEGHFQLAMVASVAGDEAGYDREIQRALELDPNFARAWLDRADKLVMQKRFEEAESLYQRARSLDPMSPGVMSSYAVHLFLMRRYDQAAAILFNQTEQFPEYVNGIAQLALVYSYMGRHEDALTQIERADLTMNPNFVVWKGIVLARAGRVPEARAIAQQVDDSARARFYPPYYRAVLHAQLGERDAAFLLLEQAKLTGEWEMARVPYDPGFDPLRADARFAALTAAR